MLEVNEIDVFYDAFQVLTNVSFTVDDGMTVALVGPNGHGKTTILKTISGLLTPRRGYIKFNDERIDGLPPHQIAKRGIVHIPEGGHLWSQMTVMENLKLGAYLPNAWKKRGESLRKIFKIFPALEQRKNQMISTLSGGERRMVAIGRGLMSCAELLLMDEPALGLAPNLVREVFRQIRDIKDTGVDIIIAEQNVRYLSEISDKICFVDNGAIRWQGKKEDLESGYLERALYLGR